MTVRSGAAILVAGLRMTISMLPNTARVMIGWPRSKPTFQQGSRSHIQLITTWGMAIISTLKAAKLKKTTISCPITITIWPTS